jgi:hypothetical protein
VITDYSVVVSLRAEKFVHVTDSDRHDTLHTDTAVRPHSATEIIASPPIYSYCDSLLFNSETSYSFVTLWENVHVCFISRMLKLFSV